MLCQGYPITYAMVSQVLQDACPLDDFFRQFAEMQNVMKIFAIAVNPDHRRKDIAESLLYQSITVAQHKFYNAVVMTSTDSDSIKLCRKLEMLDFKTAFWKDYKDPFGEKWFPKFLDEFKAEGYYKILFG